jgi:hypothetical protein
VSDRRLLARLARTVHALAHWSPVFGEVPFLPALAFPFVKFFGADDMVWLAERVAHPQPATASPPWTGQDYDVRTGPASSVILGYVGANAGPSAVTARRVAGLTLAADPAAGSTITGRARFQPLLAFLAELATGGGVTVTVTQSGASLVAAAVATVDRSADVAFAHDLGNLESSEYAVAASNGSVLYVGGQGEGTARVFTVASNGSSRRVESFADRRDVTDPAELAEVAAVLLAERAGKTSLTVNPIDTPTCRYGVHYRLGDLVRLDIDGVAVVDRVVAVRTVLSAAGLTREITIGAESSAGPIALFAGLRNLNRRITQLERI